IQQDRVDEALEQFLLLGDTQVRAGQFGKAAERFAEGVRLAERSNVASPTALNLRHRLAESWARQGEYKSALAVYQEVQQQVPDDERAHFYLVDLEFRLGQASSAMNDLEQLLDRYQAKGEPQKTTAVLEALAQNYPKEGRLADRLAKSYLAAGATGKAIDTLDGLGELYLSLGKKQAAAATIRQILALDPPRADDYRKLLEQIGE
ncbi:MAG: tetratricopeptide repeat protein, partial [Chloroflexi bacterium]|nr:tetratricopeptide repeat protein [Chloroflexota bacterium]